MKNCEEHKNIESPKCPICLANELLLHFLIRDKLQEENEELKQRIAEKEFEIEDWKCAYDGLLG